MPILSFNIVQKRLVKFVDKRRLCSCNDRQIRDVLDVRTHDLTRFPIFANEDNLCPLLRKVVGLSPLEPLDLPAL